MRVRVLFLDSDAGVLIVFFCFEKVRVNERPSVTMIIVIVHMKQGCSDQGENHRDHRNVCAEPVHIRRDSPPRLRAKSMGKALCSRNLAGYWLVIWLLRFVPCPEVPKTKAPPPYVPAYTKAGVSGLTAIAYTEVGGRPVLKADQLPAELVLLNTPPKPAAYSVVGVNGSIAIAYTGGFVRPVSAGAQFPAPLVLLNTPPKAPA